ncbi:MAG: GNAT family N-acetyltransferase [Vallitaleaceae bacterium]|nr:GNAT family N-acetyltransferase [Vallitaleaceae bacterium]
MVPLKAPEFKRIVLRNITHKKNAWPINDYKDDAFYQYALSNHGFSTNNIYEHTFSFTCHHKITGDFIGYLQGYLPTIKNALWIETFLIDKKYLQQGYGKEFYTAVTNLFKRHDGTVRVYLACFDLNLTGKLFWEKLHFMKAHETMKYNRNKGQIQKIVIYEKEIEAYLQEEYLNEQENIKNFRVQ